MKPFFNKLLILFVAMLAGWGSVLGLFASTSLANDSVCEVTTESGYNEKGSLRRFILWFNTDDYREQRYCKDHIWFDSSVKNINLEEALAIVGSPSGTEFVLGTVGSYSGVKVNITVDSYTKYKDPMKDAGVEIDDDEEGQIKISDGEVLGKCAVFIRTPKVRLRNLNFTGSNETGVNGICIDASEVVLEDVSVDGFEGDGIVLSSRASNVTFKGIVAVGPTVKTGLRMFGDYSAMQTRITLPFADSTASSWLDLLGAGENMMVLPGVAKIDQTSLCTTRDETTGKYTITGSVTCDNCQEQQQVRRMYVFKIPALGSNTTAKRVIERLSEPVAVFQNGARTDYYEAGSEGILGFFSFDYDPNEPVKVVSPPDPSAEKFGEGRLFIVPETSPGIFASSSGAIELKHQTNCVGQPQTTTPDGKKITNLTGTTLQQCLQYGAYGIDPGPLSIGLDSDGDNIPDKVEMMTFKDANPATNKELIDISSSTTGKKATCDCSNTWLCWYRPDSDFDGVPDLNDGVQVILTGGGTSGFSVKLLNTDKDDKPNVFDGDSDNDGIPDGWEDRSRVFNTSKGAKQSKAKYIYYASDGVEMSGVPSCYDAAGTVNDNKYNPDAGISYGLYYLDADGNPIFTTEGKLHPYNVGTGSAPTGATAVVSLECRNVRLMDATNFNGEPDSITGETDLKNADTDGDGICDGGGECKDPTTGVAFTGKNDPCPLTVNDPGKQCRLTCVPNEIWQGISDGLVNTDDKGHVTGFIEENGEKTLYKAIREHPEKGLDYCSDIDGDKIPDCLEWNGSLCSELDSLRRTGAQFFDPYTRDTDGDGLVDGVKQVVDGTEAKPDKCPFTAQVAGVTNDTSEDITKLSCGTSAYDVYGYQPLLAYYLDRDDDSLTDAEEDKDLSGGRPNIIQGMDGVATTESDPLLADTDADKLADWIEVRNIHTNPADQDTDGDSLSDYTEVNYDGDFTTLNVTLGAFVAQDGVCFDVTANPTQFGDTNPLKKDTDEDGIDDNIEIQITKTNPANRDSDNDGKTDLEEDTDQDGNWPKLLPNGQLTKDDNGTPDTNPCNSDTDGDGRQDGDPREAGFCAVTRDITCKTDGTASPLGVDSDSDGIPDDVELRYWIEKADGTYYHLYPNNPDSDGDGLDDCEELKGQCPKAGGNGFGPTTWDMAQNESNPLDPDTDDDGMDDKCEATYGTKAFSADSDGDGLTDAVEDTNGRILEQSSPYPGDCQYSAGAETNAMDQDTDKDGLPDGWIGNRGEDRDLNGIVTVDEKTGIPTETDPRTADSDGDGRPDGEEFCWRGVCSVNNVSRALIGQREGCNVAANGGENETWGMTAMILLTLATTRVAAVVMRRRKKKAVSG